MIKAVGPTPAAQPPICPACVSTSEIEIDSLSERELLSLNRRVVARLKMLRQGRAYEEMLRFRVGEKVAFDTRERVVFGVLTHFNRKTVTVISDDGEHWNVSPHVLQSRSDFSTAPGEKKPLKLLSGPES